MAPTTSPLAAGTVLCQEQPPQTAIASRPLHARRTSPKCQGALLRRAVDLVLSNAKVRPWLGSAHVLTRLRRLGEARLTSTAGLQGSNAHARGKAGSGARTGGC